MDGPGIPEGVISPIDSSVIQSNADAAVPKSEILGQHANTTQTDQVDESPREDKSDISEALRPSDTSQPEAQGDSGELIESSERIKVADGMAAHLEEYSAGLLTQLIEDSVKKGIDPLTAEVQARQRVEKVKSYFVLKDAEKGITPIERIAQMYDLLDVPEINTSDFRLAISSHSHEVIERAFDQHFENPEQYVSHGFDHSLNVADYTRGILEQNPQILTSMTQRYGISEGTARFMLENIAFLHDAGYPDLDGRSKAVHAIEGAEIVSTQQMRDLYVRMMPELPFTQRELLLHDLRDSIMYHNADTVQRAFEAKIVTSRGEFLVDSGNVLTVLSFFNSDPTGTSSEGSVIYVKDEATQKSLNEEFTRLGILNENTSISILVGEGISLKGRNIDLEESGDSLAGLEFRQVDTSDSPMHALIRLADNMDIKTDRFSDIQKTKAFKEIYTIFGDGGDVSQRLQLLEKISGIPVQNTPPETIKAALKQAHETLTLGLSGQELGEYREQIAKAGSASQVRDLYKQIVIDRVIDQYQELSSDESEELSRIAVAQSSESMRHFGGCEAISGFELKGNTFTVRVDSEALTRLNQIKVSEKSLDANGDITRVNVGVGEYQIWRLKEAYRSISVDGKSLNIVVVDENGIEVGNKVDQPEF